MKETIFGFTPVESVYDEVDFTYEIQELSPKKELFLSFLKEGFSMKRDLKPEEKGNNFLSVFDRWKLSKLHDPDNNGITDDLLDFTPEDVYEISYNEFLDASRDLMERNLTGKDYYDALNRYNYFSKLSEASNIGIEILERRKLNLAIRNRFNEEDQEFLAQCNIEVSSLEFDKNVNSRKFERKSNKK